MFDHCWHLLTNCQLNNHQQTVIKQTDIKTTVASVLLKTLCDDIAKFSTLSNKIVNLAVKLSTWGQNDLRRFVVQALLDTK